MKLIHHIDPNILLAAYVKLTAEILKKDVNDIDVNSPINDLFPNLAQWRKFSGRYLELAQLSSDEHLEILGQSYAGNYDDNWRFETRSLSTLAAFSDSARKLLEIRQEKLEEPTLKSLAATLATRVYHPSGIADAYYDPKSKKEVLRTVLIWLFTIPTLSAALAWLHCATQERKESSFVDNFLLICSFLGIASVCLFMVFLAYGVRAVKKANRT